MFAWTASILTSAAALGFLVWLVWDITKSEMKAAEYRRVMQQSRRPPVHDEDWH